MFCKDMVLTRLKIVMLKKAYYSIYYDYGIRINEIWINGVCLAIFVIFIDPGKAAQG